LLLKPTITKHKAQGRTTYTATIGGVSKEHHSRTTATTAVEAEALAALVRLDSGPIFGRFADRTYVVYPDSMGWRYWLDGFGPTYTCFGAWTKDGAHHAALFHLAQNEWTLTVDDAAYLAPLPDETRRELQPWITWQRQIAGLMAQGYTLDQSRDMVSQGTTAAVAS